MSLISTSTTKDLSL